MPLLRPSVAVQFDSVVTVHGRVDIGPLKSAVLATASTGEALWFARDAESGTVTVSSPGDPAVAVLAQGQPPRGASVDLPACAGVVHMVAHLRQVEPALAQGAIREAGLGRRAVLPRRPGAVGVTPHHNRGLLNAGEFVSGEFGPPPAGLSSPPPEALAPNDTTGTASEPPDVEAATGMHQGSASDSSGQPTTSKEEDSNDLSTDLNDAMDEVVNKPVNITAVGMPIAVQEPGNTEPPSPEPMPTSTESSASFTPIIIGIAAGLVLFALLAVCFIWYRRSQRGRKTQFAVAKRQDGYEYSHAYPPPSGAAPPSPRTTPPESHLSVVRPPS